jgi:hypothetical protein
MIIPNLSNEALRDIQNALICAKDDLQKALFSHWHDLGILDVEERSRVGRTRVIQCVGAYASKIFEGEAKQLVKLKLEPAALATSFDELGVRVMYQVMPPQFLIDSGFYLGDLHHDAEYRKFIEDVIGDCVGVWKKSHVPVTRGSNHPSPREIIDEYRQQAKLSIQQLAQLARVDESVIYGIKAGRKKCGDDALGRVAAVVGCEPNRLAPPRVAPPVS